MEILLLHGDPFLEEAVMEEWRALQDALVLDFRGDGHEDFEIVRIFEIGVVAVGSFDDIELLGGNMNRGGEGKGSAVEGAVGEGFSGLQGDEDLFGKTLIIYIAAGLGETLRSSLFGAKKEIIHMENIAVIKLCQFGGKGGFSCGTVAVDGDDNKIFLCQKRIDMFLYSF